MKRSSLFVALGALALTACSADQTLSPFDLDVAETIIPGDNVLAVTACVTAWEISEGTGVDDGTLGESFQVLTTSPGGDPVPSVNMTAQDINAFDVNNCAILWRHEPVLFDDETPVTSEIVLPDGFQLKQIAFTGRPGETPPETIVDPTSNAVTIVAQSGTQIFFSVIRVETPEPEPEITEGCSARFWGRLGNLDEWEGARPWQSFSRVFGVSGRNGTLLRALWGGHGFYSWRWWRQRYQARQLNRQAVAALLNARHSEVNFELSEGRIERIVQRAYETGRFRAAARRLAHYNRLDCPLN